VREHFCVTRVRNCGIRPVGSTANGKYSGNKGRKLGNGVDNGIGGCYNIVVFTA